MTHTQQPQNSQPSLMGLQALAQAQTNPQPTPPAAPASNAFRPATAANNNQQANGAAAPAPAAAPAQPQNNNANRLNRPGLFGNQEKVNAPFLPLARSVARFELDGLGDPFYRLLGHPLNPDLTSGKAIAQMLETGGENVSALEKLLETAWTGYALKGAALVYRWNQPTPSKIAQQVRTMTSLMPPADPCRSRCLAYFGRLICNWSSMCWRGRVPKSFLPMPPCCLIRAI